jgi:hypothetical protein
MDIIAISIFKVQNDVELKRNGLIRGYERSQLIYLARMLSGKLVRRRFQSRRGIFKRIELVLILLDLGQVLLGQVVRKRGNGGAEVPLVYVAMVYTAAGWVFMPDVWYFSTVNLDTYIVPLDLLPSKHGTGFGVPFFGGRDLPVLPGLSLG